MNYLSKQFQYATVKVYFYIKINMVNFKKYVGQTIDYDRRDIQHKSNCKSSNPAYQKSKLYNAMRKYGSENFITFILPIVKYGQREADAEEQRLIKKYNTFGKGSWGYNMTGGGQTGCSGINSPKWNKADSTETLEKKRIASSGKNNAMYGLLGEDNPNFGSHRTEQQCENISKSLLGKRPYNKGKKYPHLSGENSKLSKSYRLYFENGNIIEIHCLSKWSKEHGYNPSHILSVLNGKRNYHKDIIKVELIS